MIKNIAKWGVLIGAVAGVTLAFQNCSPSQFEGSSSTQSSTSGSRNNSNDNSSQGSDTGGGSALPEGGGTTVASETYVVGQLYGACSMQLDGNFKIAHNGVIDSNGNRISYVPDGMGGATYPVTYCPNSGEHTVVKCASGFKPVQKDVTQMDCRATAASPLCKTYWVTYACAKQ